MDDLLLRKYATLAVSLGANVQKGQLIRISGPVEAYSFLHMCAEEAYRLGAGQVIVDYFDNHLSRLDYENVETEVLKKVPEHKVEYAKYLIDREYCALYVESPDPDLMDGIDASKINEVMMERQKVMKPFDYYFTNNVAQWSIISYPNLKWAKKVFPEKSDDEALKALWEAVLYASRVDENSVEDNWQKHNAEIRIHCDKMNVYNFKSLHFKNSKGTDLTVGLIANHKWEGGSDTNSKGVYFNANIPTEEIFTMPDRYHIDGVVYSTKPLSYRGKIIDEFKLVFENGRVVDYDAKQNKETLKNLLETDEGSKSLGEVALISNDSPISNLNILFYDTLFDENASCHLALGQCYPSNVKDGTSLSEEELYKLGGNSSMVHVDFMFGSADMEVYGTTYDGEEIKVFEQGNFII